MRECRLNIKPTCVVRKAGLISSAEIAVRVLPVSPQATTKETTQAQARDERESVTLVEEEAPAPPTTTEGATGGKEEEEEQEEEEGGEGEPGPPITQLGNF